MCVVNVFLINVCMCVLHVCVEFLCVTSVHVLHVCICVCSECVFMLNVYVWNVCICVCMCGERVCMYVECVVN